MNVCAKEIGLSDERLDWHLENWTRWMKSGGVSLGYARMYQVGRMDFEAMCHAVDRWAARVVDAAIDSLAPADRAAVYHRHLAAIFRFPRESVDAVYRRARERLKIDLSRRGLV